MKHPWNKIGSLVPAFICSGLLPLSAFAASTPIGDLPFTGDNSKLGLAGIVMGIALVIIIVLVVSSKRKK